MESLTTKNSNEEFKEKIRKIKEYILSLFDKRNKKERGKIEKSTIEELEKTLSNGKGTEEEEGTNKGQDDKEDENLKENQTNQDKGMGGEGGEGGEGGKNQNDENTKKEEFEIPPEDQDEYIPKDMEFGESQGESSRFAEITPPFLGYYTKGKKSYFDRETNLWSKKKVLKTLTHKLTEGTKKYAYTGVITNGINAIPLPDSALPDTTTLASTGKTVPEFMVDQNGCVYLISKEKQFISFNFGLNQYGNKQTPINADNERIIFDSLSNSTQELLNNLRSSCATPQQIAATIKYYIIKNKKYSTKVQGTLRNKSNRNNYIKNLDESPILECFSANSLFVALCRELGVPARLVVGHMVQSANKEGKACITKNDGHAWSEIWDNKKGEWLRVDATPTEKEDGEKSNENGQEENENKNNNQNTDNNFGDNQDQTSGNKGKEGQNSNSKDNKSGENKDEDKSGKEKDKTDENKEGENKGEKSSKNKSDNNQNGEKKSEDQTGNDNEQQESQQNNSQDEESQSQASGKGKLREISEDKQKSPTELLDEMVEKAKEESLIKQAEQLKQALDKLENATTTEEIKNILDESGLTDFAKDMVDKIGEEKILEEEKKRMESLDDEKKIDEALNNSLLDEEYKKKLREYANMMKKKIDEEKRKLKSEMERLGFTEQELGYYKEYKQLESEVEPEVRKQIRELQKILPVNYQIQKNEKDIYRSGPHIEGSKLAEFAVTGDPLIFRRNHEVRESNEINMFETIIIDTSGSMGNINYPGSILRESIKAAIIRAKVLEHFKVDFSIVLFGDRIDEVMSFGEKFSSKKRCSIPSKLMRAAHRSGGNSREPISYVYQNMIKEFRKHRGKSFGNISFIGDGDLYNGTERPDLKAMIDDLKKRGFGVTAYYINNSWSRLIDYYFGKPEDGGAVYAGDSKELSKEIIESHKTHLKRKIRKYMK